MSALIHTFLVVDDSRDDLTLLQRAFRENGADVSFKTANNGEEALAYLEGKGKYADRQNYPLPSLIILDLKMPRRDGVDVLASLSKIQLQPMPYVVVMSGRTFSEDVENAHQEESFAYHMKPMAFADLCKVTGRLGGPTFKELFCKFFKVAPKDFVRTAIFKTLHRDAGWLFRILYLLDSETARESIRFIEKVGRTRTEEELADMISEYHNKVTGMSTLATRILNQRVSAKKVGELSRLIRGKTVVGHDDSIQFFRRDRSHAAVTVQS